MDNKTFNIVSKADNTVVIGKNIIVREPNTITIQFKNRWPLRLVIVSYIKIATFFKHFFHKNKTEHLFFYRKQGSFSTTPGIISIMSKTRKGAYKKAIKKLKKEYNKSFELYYD